MLHGVHRRPVSRLLVGKHNEGSHRCGCIPPHFMRNHLCPKRLERFVTRCLLGGRSKEARLGPKAPHPPVANNCGLGTGLGMSLAHRWLFIIYHAPSVYVCVRASPRCSKYRHLHSASCSTGACDGALGRLHRADQRPPKTCQTELYPSTPTGRSS